jgi:hypothetical protein
MQTPLDTSLPSLGQFTYRRALREDPPGFFGPGPDGPAGPDGPVGAVSLDFLALHSVAGDMFISANMR